MTEKPRRALDTMRRAARLFGLVMLDRDPHIQPRRPVNRGRACTCPTCGGIGCAECEEGVVYPDQEE